MCIVAFGWVDLTLSHKVTLTHFCRSVCKLVRCSFQGDEDDKGLSPEVVLSVGDKIMVSYKDSARYEAKILKWRKEAGGSCQFLVHYQGWNVRHDEWIERNREALFNSSKFILSVIFGVRCLIWFCT